MSFWCVWITPDLVLLWAAGRGEGTGREQQLVASCEVPNPEHLGSWERSGSCPERATTLSALLPPPSAASTVVNWFQKALLDQ